MWGLYDFQSEEDGRSVVVFGSKFLQKKVENYNTWFWQTKDWTKFSANSQIRPEPNSVITWLTVKIVVECL